MFASISIIRCTPDRQDAYLDLRRREIDPRMAGAPGFVRRTLFRSLDSVDELVLVVYWRSRDHAQAYRKGAVHDDLRRQALELLSEPLRTRDYDVLAGEGG
jgi:heme-degrading monooxygenase HmoA